MRVSSVALGALGVIALIVSAAWAQTSPYGVWKRPSTGGEIKSFECGGGVGLVVTKSADPEKVGKELLCGAQESEPGKYEGRILNLDDGKRYSGIVEVRGGGTQLKLSGCVLGGIICKSETWIRK